MRIISRLIAIALAVCTAAAAYGQDADEPVRLRLALGPDGRVHLSTESTAYMPPTLLQAPLPSPGAFGHARAARGNDLAIDFSVAGSSRSAQAPCLSAGGLASISAFGGCELSGYGGLPGVVRTGDLLIRLDDTGRAYGVDLSYGLDWLEADDGTGWLDVGDLPQAAASILLPGWVGPVLGQAGLKAERLGLGGFLWLGQDLRLNLSYEQVQGSMALFALDPGPATLLPWQTGQQDSVSLGLNYGRFAGALTGRQLRPDTPLAGPALDSLDLGFSWRMPWNAAVEFGARNLIVRPSKADGDDPAVDEGDLRVPYLRYHQEL